MTGATNCLNRAAPRVDDQVDCVVSHYYPALVPALHACLAVFGTMCLEGRTKPLSLIFETPSGYGKTAVLQMVYPLKGSRLEEHVYRSDKFTPKSFVTHAANVSRRALANCDMLPRLENKVLVTKELAPIFRGRTEELVDRFSILIAVLDGKGFISDSGMRGRRGYDRQIIFNWIGATTPLPRDVHRLMSQLGSRLLFYEVPAVQPTEAELMTYAKRDDPGTAEIECQQAVNKFLDEFYEYHPIGYCPPDCVEIPDGLVKQLVRWARFLVKARREVVYEKDRGWKPVAALRSEGPWKVINYFKELARGQALIHGRFDVEQADLDLVGAIAVSRCRATCGPL